MEEVSRRDIAKNLLSLAALGAAAAVMSGPTGTMAATGGRFPRMP